MKLPVFTGGVPVHDKVEVPPTGRVRLAGFNGLQVRPDVGEILDTVRLTVPCELEPALTEIVDVPATPTRAFSVVGLAVMK
jgi:hypothetical protein